VNHTLLIVSDCSFDDIASVFLHHLKSMCGHVISLPIVCTRLMEISPSDRRVLSVIGGSSFQSGKGSINWCSELLEAISDRHDFVVIGFVVVQISGQCIAKIDVGDLPAGRIVLNVDTNASQPCEYTLSNAGQLIA